MVFGLSSLHSAQQRSLIVAPSPAEGGDVSLSDKLKAAAWKASGGGLAGAGAMFINVGTLMWMRTTVNFQYRYGMGTFEALSHLYNEGGRGLGGIRRFYRGVGPALFQGPLSRFGDTAANAGMIELWDSFEARLPRSHTPLFPPCALIAEPRLARSRLYAMAPCAWRAFCVCCSGARPAHPAQLIALDPTPPHPHPHIRTLQILSPFPMACHPRPPRLVCL